MALKKSELYSSLWSSCDELGGGMDASRHRRLDQHEDHCPANNADEPGCIEKIAGKRFP